MAEDADDLWAAALAEQNDGEDGGEDVDAMLDAIGDIDAEMDGGGDMAGPAEPAQFQSLAESGGGGGSNEIDMDVLLDVPVTIGMEIGRAKISIRNLLQMNQGSIIELDRLAGEPLDVMVNGMLIAHGEVVVVNDRFGIRLTDVISPAERVKKLK